MPLWNVVSAGGHHDLLRVQLSFTGEKPITSAVLRQTLHGHALSHIAVHMLRETPQEGHNLSLLHEPLRLISVGREIRQLALPVGRHQAERVPTLLIPGMSDAVFVEHHGTDAVLLKRLCHRQACLPSANHHHLVKFCLMRAVDHCSAHNKSV